MVSYLVKIGFITMVFMITIRIHHFTTSHVHMNVYGYTNFPYNERLCIHIDQQIHYIHIEYEYIGTLTSTCMNLWAPSIYRWHPTHPGNHPSETIQAGNRLRIGTPAAARQHTYIESGPCTHLYIEWKQYIAFAHLFWCDRSRHFSTIIRDRPLYRPFMYHCFGDICSPAVRSCVHINVCIWRTTVYACKRISTLVFTCMNPWAPSP